LLFTLGGAGLGSAAGANADAFKRRYRATQITMELESGSVLVVVQGNDDYFVRGDRVRILGLGDDRARVQHE
jgi:outer membrane lipoprotein SlyB